jgi:hypothetical protein
LKEAAAEAAKAAGDAGDEKAALAEAEDAAEEAKDEVEDAEKMLEEINIIKNLANKISLSSQSLQTEAIDVVTQFQTAMHVARSKQATNALEAQQQSVLLKQPQLQQQQQLSSPLAAASVAFAPVETAQNSQQQQKSPPPPPPSPVLKSSQPGILLQQKSASSTSSANPLTAQQQSVSLNKQSASQLQQPHGGPGGPNNNIPISPAASAAGAPDGGGDDGGGGAEAQQQKALTVSVPKATLKTEKLHSLSKFLLNPLTSENYLTTCYLNSVLISLLAFDNSHLVTKLRDAYNKNEDNTIIKQLYEIHEDLIKDNREFNYGMYKKVKKGDEDIYMSTRVLLEELFKTFVTDIKVVLDCNKDSGGYCAFDRCILLITYLIAKFSDKHIDIDDKILKEYYDEFHNIYLGNDLLPDVIFISDSDKERIKNAIGDIIIYKMSASGTTWENFAVNNPDDDPAAGNLKTVQNLGDFIELIKNPRNGFTTLAIIMNSGCHYTTFLRYSKNEWILFNSEACGIELEDTVGNVKKFKIDEVKQKLEKQTTDTILYIEKNLQETDLVSPQPQQHSASAASAAAPLAAASSAADPLAAAPLAAAAPAASAAPALALAVKHPANPLTAQQQSVSLNKQSASQLQKAPSAAAAASAASAAAASAASAAAPAAPAAAAHGASANPLTAQHQSASLNKQSALLKNQSANQQTVQQVHSVPVPSASAVAFSSIVPVQKSLTAQQQSASLNNQSANPLTAQQQSVSLKKQSTNSLAANASKVSLVKASSISTSGSTSSSTSGSLKVVNNNIELKEADATSIFKILETYESRINSCFKEHCHRITEKEIKVCLVILVRLSLKLKLCGYLTYIVVRLKRKNMIV